uniref:EKA-like protein n=1 Tax=Strongyloides venezuelensis TaxID=75913 RepID=A0A0K0G215_STRVS
MNLLVTLIFKISLLLLSIIVSSSSLCSDKGNGKIHKHGGRKSKRKVLSSDDDSDSGQEEHALQRRKKMVTKKRSKNLKNVRDSSRVGIVNQEEIKDVNINKQTSIGTQVYHGKNPIFSDIEEKTQFLPPESEKNTSTRDELTDKSLKDTSVKSFNPSENSKNPVSSLKESVKEVEKVSGKEVKSKKEKLRKKKSKSLNSDRGEGDSLKDKIKTSDKELVVPKSPVNVKDGLKGKTVISMEEVESSRRDKNDKIRMKKSVYVMDEKFTKRVSIKENKSIRDKPTDGSVKKNLHSDYVDEMLQVKTKSIKSGKTRSGLSKVHPKNINGENFCSEKSPNRERKVKTSSKLGLYGTSPDVNVNSKKGISIKDPKSKKEINNRVRSTANTSKKIITDISKSSIRDQDKEKVDKSKVSLKKQSIKNSELFGKEQKQKPIEDKGEIKSKNSDKKKNTHSNKRGGYEASKNINIKSDKGKTFKLNDNSISEKDKVKPKDSSKKENLESSLKDKIDSSKKKVSKINNDKKLLNNSKKKLPGDSRKIIRSSRESSLPNAPEVKIIDDTDFAKNMGKAMELFDKRRKEKMRSKVKKDEDEEPQSGQSTSEPSNKKKKSVRGSLKKMSKKMFTKK